MVLLSHVLSFSEAGGSRPNEDAFLVQPHPADPGCWLCLLADGQGGRAGGARAAQLACRTALAVAVLHPTEELVNPRTWPTILREADRTVAADPEAGFTTLVGLCVAGDQVTGASSGDSAALATTPGGVATVLTLGQHKDPPVGSGVAAFVLFTLALPRPWSVLAMSDGVWKYVGWGRLVETARGERGQALVSRLQECARLRGSGLFQDDFTVVLL